MKLLIDECLHLSLTKLAHEAGFAADHVNYLGLSGVEDRRLMRLIIEKEYTFVTNNRSDFLVLHRAEPLHAGLVIVIPNVTPTKQRELFAVALKCLREGDITNTVLELNYRGGRARYRQYPLFLQEKPG